MLTTYMKFRDQHAEQEEVSWPITLAIQKTRAVEA